MPAIPKTIDFADIQVGDTIRVVEVNDVKVTENRVHAIRTEDGNVYLARPVRRGAKRTFQLVERPMPQLPTDLGSTIEVHGEAGHWVFIYEVANGHGVWISVNGGSRRSMESMRSRVKGAGGFEVIR